MKSMPKRDLQKAREKGVCLDTQVLREKTPAGIPAWQRRSWDSANDASSVQISATHTGNPE